MKIYKESYIKKKSHKDSIKNRYDSYDCSRVLSKNKKPIVKCLLL